MVFVLGRLSRLPDCSTLQHDFGKVSYFCCSFAEGRTRSLSWNIFVGRFLRSSFRRDSEPLRGKKMLTRKKKWGEQRRAATLLQVVCRAAELQRLCVNSSVVAHGDPPGWLWADLEVAARASPSAGIPVTCQRSQRLEPKRFGHFVLSHVGALQQEAVHQQTLRGVLLPHNSSKLMICSAITSLFSTFLTLLCLESGSRHCAYRLHSFFFFFLISLSPNWCILKCDKSIFLNL